MVAKARFAQQARFWSTTVDLLKSKAEIEKYLDGPKVNADQIIVVWDKSAKVLTVQFIYDDMLCRIQYKPLAVDLGDMLNTGNWGTPEQQADRRERLRQQNKAKIDKLEEQAVRQMGRRALNHIGVILDMFEEGYSEALLPYRQLPGNGPTLQQLGVDGMIRMIEDANSGMLALKPSNDGESVDADFVEIVD